MGGPLSLDLRIDTSMNMFLEGSEEEPVLGGHAS